MRNQSAVEDLVMTTGAGMEHPFQQETKCKKIVTHAGKTHRPKSGSFLIFKKKHTERKRSCGTILFA